MSSNKSSHLANDISSIIGNEDSKDSLIESFSATMDLLSDGVMFLNLNWEF